MDRIKRMRDYEAWLVGKKDTLQKNFDPHSKDGWAPYDFAYSVKIIHDMLVVQKEYFEQFSNDISQADPNDTSAIIDELTEAIRLYDEAEKLLKTTKFEEQDEAWKKFFDYYATHFMNWWD